MFKKIQVFWDVTTCQLVTIYRLTRHHIPEDLNQLTYCFAVLGTTRFIFI